MSKKMLHEPVLRHIGRATDPMMRELYLRVKAAYEAVYDPAVTAVVSKTYTTTVAGFTLKIAVCSPAKLSETGKEYIYIILQNDSVRTFVSGLLSDVIDYANITTETLPGLFDFVDLYSAVEEVTTSIVGTSWSFPVDTVVIEKT